MNDQTFADQNLKPTSEGYGAVLFYSEFDDPNAWGDALKTNIPGLDFRVYPDVGNPDDVRHILAWKAYPGFFEPFRNLAQVVNLGAGVDALVGRNDLPDVPISRLSDPGMVALMRSYVLFSVIRYARDIPSFEKAQRRREWHYIHPRPLHQIKVGILGLGHLGAAVASGLREAGFDVRGWDHATKSIAGVKCYSAADDRNEFLSEVEILVNMMPLTPGTTGLIDRDLLNALPRGAKFVNASRGPVVDEPALIEALRSGQIGGATLDVFCVEPLPADHPFWTMENVLVTPHLASITVPEAAARDVAESIRRVSAGGEPLHRVDPQRGY
ncbi:glyoxylate/hydroxypyruvate reductase A [Aminobacter sp. AP02]|uniref:2-hydroxyacid dehydrogenase n=1 Tax=Aminobacter sp. AP02 TaxID=2135737 RepID=UPI000D6C67B5|nr:glyoxylate/hydroxypyruvate reductase A [Aminobacter sp. AP02]PWK61255.1 glyoxylate/hydroxypyruvate reductase A [Aminobacter sp. AP02]